MGKPQRFLANTLSSLKISCDNYERGCRKVVELGSLCSHIVNCDFSPVPCSNDQCDEIINRRDKEIHENKVCHSRLVKCDYCAQMMLYKNYLQHACPPRREVSEIKAELREIRSTQAEMLKILQDMRSSYAARPRYENQARRTNTSRTCNAQELQAQIVVAGGNLCQFFEVFNMTTKTWRRVSEMNGSRSGASSVLYQGRMIVTGGRFDKFLLNSIEELNIAQQHEQWTESQFNLPMPSQGHACVVRQNCLLVIGGIGKDGVYDTIYEIQLIPPYRSRLLTRMPLPLCFHGAVQVNDKIYIIGGTTTVFNTHSTNIVLIFYPTTNSFTEVRPLPYSVSEMATVIWKDNVLVLGGVDKQCNRLNTVLLYCVATDSYHMLPKMSKKRNGCTAIVIGDNVIAMGGKDETDTALSSVECYNFNTNTWTEFPSMTEARSFHTSVVKYP